MFENQVCAKAGMCQSNILHYRSQIVGLLRVIENNPESTPAKSAKTQIIGLKEKITKEQSWLEEHECTRGKCDS